MRRISLSHEGMVLRREREKPLLSKKRITYAILFCVAAIGWMNLLMTSDRLTIKDVETSGLKKMESEDVKREVYEILDERGSWRPWPARHRWFIDKENLEKKLKDRLFAENVTVDKLSFGILRLKIEERAKRVIFHSHQQYVWVDLNGLITEALTYEERRDAQSRILGQRPSYIDDAPIVHADLERDLRVGENAAESDDVRTWIQNAALIMKQGFFYREMTPSQDASSTTAFLLAPEGYRVMVDLAEPLLPQIRSYMAFVIASRSEIKVSEYVDARIPGKVYVK